MVDWLQTMIATRNTNTYLAQTLCVGCTMIVLKKILWNVKKCQIHILNSAKMLYMHYKKLRWRENTLKGSCRPKRKQFYSQYGHTTITRYVITLLIGQQCSLLKRAKSSITTHSVSFISGCCCFLNYSDPSNFDFHLCEKIKHANMNTLIYAVFTWKHTSRSHTGYFHSSENLKRTLSYARQAITILPWILERRRPMEGPPPCRRGCGILI